MSAFKKLYILFNHRERVQAWFCLFLIALMAVSEAVGLASIMPFMAAVANPELIHENPYYKWAYEHSGARSRDMFLYALGLAALVLTTCSICIRALTTYVTTRFASMRGYTLSARLVDTYLHHTYEWFLNRNPSDLGKTVLAEVDQVVRNVMLPLAQLVSGVAITTVLLIIIVAASPLTASLTSGVLVTTYLLMYRALRTQLKSLGQTRLQANSLRYQVVSESFGGIKEIKLANAEHVFQGRFNEPAALYAKAEARGILLSQMPRYVVEAIGYGGMLALTLFTIREYGGVAAALPYIALFGLAAYRLLPTLQQIYMATAMLRFAETTLNRLCDDLTVPLRQPLTEKPASSWSNFQHNVSLSRVSYRYPGAARNAIDDVSIEIRVRSSVAIVGATGSGKTTVVDLLLGLLRPDIGTLLVDDVNVSEAELHIWQRQIGYVPQTLYLTDDTIAANIAFGVPSKLIDMEAVERAARIAYLHDFIVNDLPDGYTTVIGDRGIRLSGGQRQRIGLARALYRTPSLLVLDEATSALDNQTERLILEEIAKLRGAATVLMIAHRLSTVRCCDNIYLLERGKLVASGTYDELCKTNELFHKLAIAGDST